MYEPHELMSRARGQRRDASRSSVTPIPTRQPTLSTRRPASQTRLVVGAAGDRFEREADRVSEEVIALLSSERAQLRPAPRSPTADAGELQRSRIRRSTSANVVRTSHDRSGTMRAQRESASEAGGAASGLRSRLPDPVVRGVRALSGTNLADVSVHFGSTMPARFGARAMAFDGAHIAVVPGAEHTLAHEAWHIVQQRQGRVRPNAMTRDGSALSTDVRLEHEADQAASRIRARETTHPAEGDQVGPWSPPSSRIVNRFAQLVQITTGILTQKRVLWDTEWPEETKSERLRNLSVADAQHITKSRFFEKEIEKWRLLLKEKATPPKAVPGPASIKAPPHKKTPEGKTQHLMLTFSGEASTEAKTDIEHIRFFVQKSKEIGFRITVITTEAGRQQLTTAGIPDDIEWEIPNEKLSRWAEDNMEFVGDVRAETRHFDADLLEAGMLAGRADRWQDLSGFEGSKAAKEVATVSKGQHKIVPLGTLVNTPEKMGAKTPSGDDRRRIRAYIEGGNMLSGEDALGQPLILIGRDSIDATARLYEIQPGEVLQLLAEDFAIALDRIIPVEQPGTFHLDMGMLFIGKGQVIVSDSSAEVAKLREEQGEVTKSLNLVNKLEDMAAQQLKKAGLQVVRSKLSGDYWNFFNGEFVTGKDGRHYFLTNGADSNQQAKFKTLMVDTLKVVADVFFTPAEVASSSLASQGGVGCRAKGRPSPENQKLLDVVQ